MKEDMAGLTWFFTEYLHLVIFFTHKNNYNIITTIINTNLLQILLDKTLLASLCTDFTDMGRKFYI